MECSITIPDIDDARDMFLLAKDRLLDINDWNALFENNHFKIQLTNSRGERLHRDARINDLIHIYASSHSGINSDSWVRIQQIQYDFFPDIRCESVSILLSTSNSPSGEGIESEQIAFETILIKRERSVITAHCNGGNELPLKADEHPDEHIDPSTDIHPVISIPGENLAQILKGFIAQNVR